MNDAENTLETPETVEAETEAPETEATKSFFARIKDTGETGKKEWEELLSKARETVQKHSNSLYAKAQDRGANLMLRLLAGVRKSAEALEKSISEARKAADEAEASEAPAAA